jgi:dolichol-phosphate mannosyltransferase
LFDRNRERREIRRVSKTAMKISVIVPVFNEGDSVRVARDRIAQMFARDLPEHAYEIVFVDDGSGDDSGTHLSVLAEKDARVKVIQLEHNFGSHMAVRAGMDFCTGDAFFYLPCDLQEPPEMLPKLLELLKGPVEIVYAVRESRRDSLSNRIGSRIFFGLARALVSRNIAPAGAGSFVLGPRAVKCARLFHERNLSWDGLLASLPFPHAYLSYERAARTQGQSKWTLEKRLKLFADFFVGFSYTPIRSMAYIGLATAMGGFGYAIVVFFNRIFFQNPIEGWSSLMLVLLVVSGIQMIMLGIIGEYVWRTLDESRQRPRYIVRKMLNVGRAPAPELVLLSGAEPAKNATDGIAAGEAAVIRSSMKES